MTVNIYSLVAAHKPYLDFVQLDWVNIFFNYLFLLKNNCYARRAAGSHHLGRSEKICYTSKFCDAKSSDGILAI